MSEFSTNEIIIEGMTNKGKRFRPSDWSERLSGILSSFDHDHRLSYHSYVRPIIIDEIRCVGIDKNLETASAEMFRFLMDFAHDNDLRIIDGASVLKQTITEPTTATTSIDTVQTTTTPTDSHPIETLEKNQFIIRDIDADETGKAFQAMLALHQHLPSEKDFVLFVNNTLRPLGYRLIGIFEEGRNQAIAVCGFRYLHNLAWGKYLYIDDLSTLPQYAHQGFAKQLLDFVHQEAKNNGRLPIHLDARVGIEREDSHRLFFNSGFRISSYHFMRQR